MFKLDMDDFKEKQEEWKRRKEAFIDEHITKEYLEEKWVVVKRFYTANLLGFVSEVEEERMVELFNTEDEAKAHMLIPVEKYEKRNRDVYVVMTTGFMLVYTINKIMI